MIDIALRQLTVATMLCQHGRHQVNADVLQPGMSLHQGREVRTGSRADIEDALITTPLDTTQNPFNEVRAGNGVLFVYLLTCTQIFIGCILTPQNVLMF